MSNINFKALGNNVIIEVPKVKEQTKGGVYKPKSVLEAEAKEAPQDYVKVLAVGEGCKIVKEGDYIFTAAFITGYNMEGERFGVIQEEFIIGIKNK